MGDPASRLCQLFTDCGDRSNPVTRRRSTFRAGALLACLFLAASFQAAAGQSPDASTSQSSSEPRAQRIVSLAPNLTELMFAAGAGDRIVGTPQYSDYPAAARSIPRIGDAFRFDFERVLALRPDAVLAWEPGTPVAVVERLKALNLRVVAIATWHIADIPRAVRELGRIAGTTDQGYRVRPASFELWARSLEDIRVLQAPSWWTPQRLTAAVAALASAILAALVWVYLLRRRIREQTSIIRSQLAREIVLDERQRIAREVHDTLEQEMVGLALRLDAALSVADPRVSTILDSTRPLISRIQGELRSLVWDLREQAEGPHNLTAALEQTARELQAETTSTLQFQLKGVPWSLPGSVGHDLLRIARETIANALKHANPSTIKVELSYAPNHLTLSVQDDGQGFELNNPSLARPGHFGLIGIQERARKMGAGLQLKSKAGEGTLIEVRVGRTLGLPGDSLHDEP